MIRKLGLMTAAFYAALTIGCEIDPTHVKRIDDTTYKTRGKTIEISGRGYESNGTESLSGIVTTDKFPDSRGIEFTVWKNGNDCGMKLPKAMAWFGTYAGEVTDRGCDTLQKHEEWHRYRSMEEMESGGQPIDSVEHDSDLRSFYDMLMAVYFSDKCLTERGEPWIHDKVGLIDKNFSGIGLVRGSQKHCTK